MEFTAEQTEAVTRRQGELLLDAGAGSGKTSVLVERFARSVADDGVAVGRMLTITFTEKAAAELRERIRKRLRTAGDHEAARATEDAWISTIHAFCARLLRAHALDAGLDPEFTVMDEPEGEPLRTAAFDAALEACAKTAPGSELVAAYGPAALRATTLAVYAELRARGMAEPALPPAPAPPDPLDLRGSCLLVADVAAAVLRELAGLRDPGKRVREAIEQLECAPSVLESGRPWPGDLLRLRLGAAAGALRSDACESYRAALAELEALAGGAAAAGVRGALDALLREYGSRYTELKRVRGVLDFSDLELRARDLLRTPEIGNRYRERFVRVMVDEVQDVNQVQMELIDLIAGASLAMVGDAQQAIYGFRHADPELFEQRGQRLARFGARLPLQTNFRSRPEILDALNGAFAGVLGDRFMSLLPGRDEVPAGEPRVELIVADRNGPVTEDDLFVEQTAAAWRVTEARALARRVSELIASGQARAGDVVVLLRASTDMHVYEQALTSCGVPTYVIGGRGYWSHPQVVELSSYLRALANPLDAEALYGVLSSPLCGLSVDGLVLHAAGETHLLGDQDRDALERFYAWFGDERRASAWLGPEQLLDRALVHGGYELHVAGLADARRRLANVRKLLRLAREWQQRHGSDLRGFADLLQSRVVSGGGSRESEAPVEGEALDAVRLMTIHRSKGLEFPIVCVADLGRRVAPRPGALVKLGRDGRSLGLRLRRAGHGERVSVLAYDALRLEERVREQEEERRLFYVAMTRARERLIVSGAARLDAWEESNRFAPIGWIGAALVPGIEARAVVAAAQARGTTPDPFVTTDGVHVRFLAAGAGGTVDVPEAARGLAPPHAPGALAALAAGPGLAQADPGSFGASSAPVSLSYTALATFAQCPYRYYVQRVLGLPDLPTPALAAGAAAGTAGTADTAAGGGQRAPQAAARGTMIHSLLAAIDLRAPELRDPMPADVRALLMELVGSQSFARIAALRDVRREQRFAFPVGDTLITGVFDLIAQERPGCLLVLDYKSDRLGAPDAAMRLSDRYQVQRVIYGLAALKLGASEVEVMHLFLEAPEAPVTVEYAAADASALESALTARLAAVADAGADGFPVTGLPGRRVCDGCPAQGGLCSHPLELTSR